MIFPMEKKEMETAYRSRDLIDMFHTPFQKNIVYFSVKFSRTVHEIKFRFIRF